jgi:DNA polymerase-3 subunit beta
MKGESFKEKLERAVRHASRMTSKNPSLPVLSCVLLEAKKGSVVVRATNIDVAYEGIVPAKIEKEGVVAVSGLSLHSFLSGLSSQNVSFSANSGGMTVTGGNSSALFKIFPHEDFPKFSASQNQQKHFPSSEFANGLKSVLYSASISSVRPELGSVYIFQEGNGIVFVATDSFRLAEKQIFPQKNLSIQPTLLPAKNAAELLRVLTESENGLCAIESKDGQFSVLSDGNSFVSRIVDGSFPDYKQIIPKEFSTTATLLKDDLLKALQLAAALYEKTNQILISIPEKGKEITISVKNAEVGEGTSSLPAAVEGGPFEASFNARYLSDCLGAIPDASISLLFSGSGKPLLIKGAAGRDFRYIVMPMNR